MNRLNIQDRARILHCLVEGSSLRATSRMMDVSINTVTKLLVDVGIACAEYQDQALRDLPCKRVQCDEIWAFCYAKQKNVPDDRKAIFGYGDVYTWTALCADTKLIACWHVGRRDGAAASVFIDDLRGRLSNRVQLTTDGHKPLLRCCGESLRSRYRLRHAREALWRRSSGAWRGTQVQPWRVLRHYQRNG